MCDNCLLNEHEIYKDMTLSIEETLRLLNNLEGPKPYMLDAIMKVSTGRKSKVRAWMIKTGNFLITSIPEYSKDSDFSYIEKNVLKDLNKLRIPKPFIKELENILYETSLKEAEKLNNVYLKKSQQIEKAKNKLESNLFQRAKAAAKSISSTLLDGFIKKVSNTFRASKRNPPSHSQIQRDLNTWNKDRAVWKSDEIELTEKATVLNIVSKDILQNKKDPYKETKKYYVLPLRAVCGVCQSYVARNPYSYREAMQLQLPNHPRCVHYLEVFSE